MHEFLLINKFSQKQRPIEKEGFRSTEDAGISLNNDLKTI